MRRGRSAIAAAACLAVPAAAHPVDEVVQAAYLLIEPGTVRLELDLTPGPVVAPAILRDLDPDANRLITRGEARAYAVQVLQRCRLSLDGQPVAWELSQVQVPSYAVLAEQAGTIEILARTGRDERAGRHQLAYTSGYAPARGPVMANIFMGRDQRGYKVLAQGRSEDGHHLRVSYQTD